MLHCCLLKRFLFGIQGLTPLRWTARFRNSLKNSTYVFMWPGSQPAAVWAWMSLGLPRAASRGQSFQILTFFQKAGLSQRLLWQRGLAGSVSSSSRSLLEPLVIYCVQFEVLMCPPAERLCQSAQDTARGWSLCLIAVYLGARWALTFLSLSVWRAWW